jgi:outer membrane protein OmpA-like peptidoglycan-associated protein
MVPVKSGNYMRSAAGSSGVADIRQSDSLLELNITRLTDTKSIKKIIFYKAKDPFFPENNARFIKIGASGRKKISNNLKSLQTKITTDLARWKFQQNPSLDTAAIRNRYKEEYNGYLKGKINNNFSILWLSVAGIPIDNNEKNTSYRARINIRKGPDIYVYTDTVPVDAFRMLPQADSGFCKPIDRYFNFKKLRGYGYEKIIPLRYIPSGRKVITKDFEVLFGRNSTQVDPDILEPIIRFLENNHYSILNASVQGYASVEGPEENNYRLQHKRAELMLNILQQHNEDEINLDTVIAEENWEMFFKQIKGTPFEYMDSLSRDSLRVLLKDSLLLVKLDPLLKEERKAMLNLTLADIFTPEDINRNILYDIRNFSRYLSSPVRDNLSQVNLNKAAGILFTLENRIDSKRISRESAESALQEINNPVIWLMYFYLAVRKFEETGRSPAMFSWSEIIRKAQSSAIILINNSENASWRSLFISQAVDVQYYTFRFIDQNILNSSILGGMDYPDEPVFYPLILNRYAYINSNGFRKPGDTLYYNDLKQYFNSAQARYYPAYKSVPERIQRPPASVFNVTYSGSWNIKPEYDTYYQSAYYYFIKKIFVYGDESIKQYVWQSDNLYEFDLFDLLRRNISGWDPIKNSYFDRDIDVNLMARLVQSLQGIDARICPMEKNQLYLDFYLKYLYYYKLYGNPYDREQLFVIQRAIRYVGEYYIARAGVLTAEQVLFVYRQMNLFYGLPGHEMSMFWSYRILKEYLKSSKGTEDIKRKYVLLASFYENRMEPVLDSMSGISDGICSFFSGAYHLKPWREDVQEFYKKYCFQPLNK